MGSSSKSKEQRLSETFSTSSKKSSSVTQRLDEVFGTTDTLKSVPNDAMTRPTQESMAGRIFGTTNTSERLQTAAVSGLPAAVGGVHPQEALEQAGQTALGFAEGYTAGIPRGLAEKASGQTFPELRGNLTGRIAGAAVGIPGKVFQAISGAKILTGKPLLNLVTSSGAAGFASSPEISEDPFNVSARLGQGIASAVLAKPTELALKGAMASVPGIISQARRMFPVTNADKLLVARESMREAEKITAQILQPKIKDYADSISKGYKLPAIQQGARRMEHVESFDELVAVFDDTIEKTFKQRNAILISENNPINTVEIMDDVISFIKKSQSEKIYSGSQLRKMGNILSQEIDFLTQNPLFNIADAQARKEVLQKATLPLLNKRSAGNLTGTENAELVVRDAIRSTYRKSILRNLPLDKAKIVDKANKQYEGLIEARDLAANSAAKAQAEMPKTLLEKIAASFGLSPKFTAARLVLKGISGAGKPHLSKLSEKASNLRDRSLALRALVKASRGR